MFSTHDHIQFVVLATVNNKTYYKLQILMIIMLVNSAVLLYIGGITSIHVLPRFHLQIRNLYNFGSGGSVNMADTENFNH